MRKPAKGQALSFLFRQCQAELFKSRPEPDFECRSIGDRIDPWGVPSVPARTKPSSIMPAFSILCIKRNIRGPPIRCLRNFSIQSWFTLSKTLFLVALICRNFSWISVLSKSPAPQTFTLTSCERERRHEPHMAALVQLFTSLTAGS